MEQHVPTNKLLMHRQLQANTTVYTYVHSGLLKQDVQVIVDILSDLICLLMDL